MVSQAYTDNLFSVYPEDLVQELVLYRSNLQRLLDYHSNKLPRIFSLVNMIMEIMTNLTNTGPDRWILHCVLGNLGTAVHGWTSDPGQSCPSKFDESKSLMCADVLCTMSVV